MPTTTPTLASYLAYWLGEVVEPNLAPKTAERYALFIRLYFARHFALRCSKAGIRYIKVHDTRRTCASLLVALDVHPRVAMQILRHTQFTVTMEVYSQVPSAKTRSALKRLGRQLGG
jgi:integrase